MFNKISETGLINLLNGLKGFVNKLIEITQYCIENDVIFTGILKKRDYDYDIRECVGGD